MRILLTEEINKRIEDDKKAFEATIGGGKWSKCDVIKEYIKRIDTENGR